MRIRPRETLIIRRGIFAALAVVSAAMPPAAVGADLGRLFFTPQQRQDMDRRRLTNAQESVVVVESVLTVDGHVSRSGGPATTWINGAPQNDSRPGRDPSQVVIQPTESEPKVSVKVGQTLDRVRGEVREGFGAGEVKVGPQPRKPR